MIWEIEGPLLRQVTEIEKEVVIVLLLHFLASNWLRANISQVTQPQPGFTPVAGSWGLTGGAVFLFIYQGDSGGPLYKFNETAHKAVLGSFIDSTHLKKHFWLWVNILREQLGKWSVTSGCCQQRRGLRPGRRHRNLRSGQGLAPFLDTGLYECLITSLFQHHMKWIRRIVKTGGCWKQFKFH